MKIIGAGLAGLLAANMLRKYSPTVIESNSELPNNHTALLRHRGKKVSEATSIPFRMVSVRKAISYGGVLHNEPSIALSNLYSKKVTGGYFNRSISNIETVSRYISPDNFISQLSLGCDIKYGIEFDFKSTDERPIISTIPMPVIAKKMNYDVGVNFEYRNISVVNFYINNPDCDVYQTIYYPDPNIALYRASITGNKGIFEFMGPISEAEIFRSLERDFGMLNLDICNFKQSKNKYGKIKDIDSDKRKEFIKFLTDEYNIYSLGRYATWRNILLDDVHDDILVIKKLIESNGYLT